MDFTALRYFRETVHSHSICAAWKPPCASQAAIAVAIALTGCTPQKQVDLSTALAGIDRSRFLACAGPPSLEMPEGGQDRMWFVTNLKRGETIGVLSPAAAAPESCSVAAVFQDSRLVSSTFSGNQSMCQMVFAPCIGK